MYTILCSAPLVARQRPAKGAYRLQNARSACRHRVLISHLGSCVLILCLVHPQLPAAEASRFILVPNCKLQVHGILCRQETANPKPSTSRSSRCQGPGHCLEHCGSSPRKRCKSRLTWAAEALDIPKPEHTPEPSFGSVAFRLFEQRRLNFGVVG